jgi:hypothetical protein
MDWNMARDHSHARLAAHRWIPAQSLVMAIIIPARTNTTIRACVMSQKRGTAA